MSEEKRIVGENAIKAAIVRDYAEEILTIYIQAIVDANVDYKSIVNKALDDLVVSVKSYLKEDEK